MIKLCTCEHEYQDQKYGKGRRVWNPTSKGRCCTVCGKSVVEDTSKEISAKSKRRK